MAAIVALLAVAPVTAARTTNPLAGGTTTLHLKRGFLAELAAKDIHLSAGGGALGGAGPTLALAVVGGALDPVDGKGLIDQAGVLRLRHHRRGVAITAVEAETARGIVRAEVAGARMKLGFLVGRTSERVGFGVNVKASALRLSAKAARRLSRRLGLDPAGGLTAGRPLSNLYSETRPRTVAIAPLPGYSVLLEIDPYTHTAATKIFAKNLLPVGTSPATTHFPMSSIWPPIRMIVFFPVETGSVALDASQGTLELGGGFRVLMPANGVAVERANLTLDLGAKAMTNPEGQIVTLDFSGANVSADPTRREIFVRGIEAALSAPFAAQLNDRFDPFLPAPVPATDFQQGDVLGVINLFLRAR